MEERIVPITLVNGFYEGGKTTVLSKIIQQGFGQFVGTTLLIDMEEEGEVSYNKELLQQRGVVLLDVENPFAVTEAYLQALEKAYKPQQVLIEYNGMFLVSYLDKMKLPEGWQIARQMTVMDGSVFAVYLESAKAQFEDMVKYSNVVMFNRCKEDLHMLGHFKEHVLAVNPRAQVVFEDQEGKLITCI